MRQYWQLDYHGEFGWKTRYFYGTEAKVQGRAKRYTCDVKELKNISKSIAQYLKEEKKAHIIVL